MKGYNKKRKLNNKKSCGIEKNIKLYAQLYYIPFRNKKGKNLMYGSKQWEKEIKSSYSQRLYTYIAHNA